MTKTGTPSGDTRGRCGRCTIYKGEPANVFLRSEDEAKCEIFTIK